jgi:hypothetical protein
VPTISWFYGIAIRMFYRDHPPPHVLAVYGGFEANVDIATGEVIAGHLPRNAARLVRQWVFAHRAELAANWNRARANLPLERIAGLDGDQGHED